MGGTILIQDSPEGTFTVTALGPLVGQLDVFACGPTQAAERCDFSVIGPLATTQMLQDFGFINMFDPGGQTISDTLDTVAGDAVGRGFVFLSDLEGGPPLIPVGGTEFTNNLVEDGTAQTVMLLSYFNGQTLIGTDIIQIQSDLEGVPEPSTWMMALSGLAMVSIPAIRRRVRS